jgi:hypothetical protein
LGFRPRVLPMCLYMFQKALHALFITLFSYAFHVHNKTKVFILGTQVQCLSTEGRFLQTP